MMIIRVYSTHTSLYGTAKIIIEPLYCHKKDLILRVSFVV